MNSYMGDKLAFLSCVLMSTHTHTSNWLAFLPDTANAMLQSPPEEFQVESTEIWTYQSIGHVTSTPFTVEVKSEYSSRKDTHH